MPPPGHYFGVLSSLLLSMSLALTSFSYCQSWFRRKAIDYPIFYSFFSVLVDTVAAKSSYGTQSSGGSFGLSQSMHSPEHFILSSMSAMAIVISLSMGHHFSHAFRNHPQEEFASSTGVLCWCVISVS